MATGMKERHNCQKNDNEKRRQHNLNSTIITSGAHPKPNIIKKNQLTLLYPKFHRQSTPAYQN